MEPKKQKLIVSMLGFFLIYLGIVALILRQWHSPEPWERLDRYVVAALAFSLGMAVVQTVTSLRLSSSADVTNEFFGLTFDKAMSGWISAIAVFELFAFADYAHWRIVPSLANPVLQSSGVVLYVLAFAWMWRVDKFMITNFETATREHHLMEGGPFQRLCHPRYSALLLSRIAFVLTIASVIAWALFLGWVLVILRRIWLEEAHLREQFGTIYEDFQRKRSRLIPLIF